MISNVKVRAFRRGISAQGSHSLVLSTTGGQTKEQTAVVLKQTFLITQPSWHSALRWADF